MYSCFHVLYFIMLQCIWRYVYLFKLVFMFPSDTYPWVELLDHVVVLFRNFWGSSILFSIVAAPICIPPTVHKHSLFSISSRTFVISCLFDSHSDRCEVISHYVATIYFMLRLHRHYSKFMFPYKEQSGASGIDIHIAVIVLVTLAVSHFGYLCMGICWFILCKEESQKINKWNLGSLLPPNVRYTTLFFQLYCLWWFHILIQKYSLSVIY